MSHEFTSPIVMTVEEAAILRTHLLYGRYALLPESRPLEIRLRYDIFGHRAEWPEDACITFRPTLVLALHAGTPRQRSDLVKFVVKSLSAIGHEATLEEL